MGAGTKQGKLYSVEGIAAVVGLAACLLLTAYIAVTVGQQQPIWPLPGVYFVEVVLLAAAAAWGIWVATPGGSAQAWAAVGAMLGFAVIGGFSVGLYYLPIVALLGLAALWRDRSWGWRRLPLHVIVTLVAAWAQATLMLALIRLLAPNTAL